MAGIDGQFPIHMEQAGERGAHFFVAAAGKIGSSVTVCKESIAGKDRLVLLVQQTDAARRVARRAEAGEADASVSDRA